MKNQPTDCAYLCPRCHYAASSRQVYEKHLQRKYTCLPKYEDVPISNLLQNIPVIQSKRKQSINKGLIEPEEENKKHNMLNGSCNPNDAKEKDIQEYKNIIAMSSELHELVLMLPQLQKLIANKDMHHKNPFGFESAFHINKNFLSKYWNDAKQCIIKVILDLYFNDSVPENRIIYKSRRSGFCHIYKGRSCWAEMKEMLVVKKVAERAIDVIEVIGGDDIPEGTITYMYQYFDGNQDIVSDLHDEIFGLLTIYASNNPHSV